jgi:Flp pilus assembly protein TadD
MSSTHPPTLAEQLGIFTGEQAKLIADMGFDLLNSGDNEGAAVIFRGLLALNERDAGVRAALGVVYLEQGKHAEAMAEFNSALEYDPRTVVALVNRGEIRVRAGDSRGLDDLKLAASFDSPMKARAQASLKAA